MGKPVNEIKTIYIRQFSKHMRKRPKFCDTIDVAEDAIVESMGLARYIIVIICRNKQRILQQAWQTWTKATGVIHDYDQDIRVILSRPLLIDEMRTEFEIEVLWKWVLQYADIDPTGIANSLRSCNKKAAVIAVLQQCRMEKFQNGDPIVFQGNLPRPEDGHFTILSGECEVLQFQDQSVQLFKLQDCVRKKKWDDANVLLHTAQPLAKIMAPSGFGELASLTNVKRAATIRCRKSKSGACCFVLVVPKQQFMECLEARRQDSKDTNNLSETIDFLRQSGLANRISPKELVAAANTMIKRTLLRGEVLFCKGEPVNSIYLTVGGEFILDIGDSIESEGFQPFQNSNLEECYHMTGGTILGDEGVVGHESKFESTCAVVSEAAVIFEAVGFGMAFLAERIGALRFCALAYKDRPRWTAPLQMAEQLNLYSNFNSLRKAIAYTHPYRGTVLKAFINDSKSDKHEATLDRSNSSHIHNAANMVINASSRNVSRIGTANSPMNNGTLSSRPSLSRHATTRDTKSIGSFTTSTGNLQHMQSSISDEEAQDDRAPIQAYRGTKIVHDMFSGITRRMLSNVALHHAVAVNRAAKKVAAQQVKIHGQEIILMGQLVQEQPLLQGLELQELEMTESKLKNSIVNFKARQVMTAQAQAMAAVDPAVSNVAMSFFAAIADDSVCDGDEKASDNFEVVKDVGDPRFRPPVFDDPAMGGGGRPGRGQSFDSGSRSRSMSYEDGPRSPKEPDNLSFQGDGLPYLSMIDENDRMDFPPIGKTIIERYFEWLDRMLNKTPAVKKKGEHDSDSNATSCISRGLSRAGSCQSIKSPIRNGKGMISKAAPSLPTLTALSPIRVSKTPDEMGVKWRPPSPPACGNTELLNVPFSQPSQSNNKSRKPAVLPVHHATKAAPKLKGPKLKIDNISSEALMGANEGHEIGMFDHVNDKDDDSTGTGTGAPVVPPINLSSVTGKAPDSTNKVKSKLRQSVSLAAPMAAPKISAPPVAPFRRMETPACRRVMSLVTVATVKPDIITVQGQDKEIDVSNLKSIDSPRAFLEALESKEFSVRKQHKPGNLWSTRFMKSTDNATSGVNNDIGMSVWLQKTLGTTGMMTTASSRVATARSSNSSFNNAATDNANISPIKEVTDDVPFIDVDMLGQVMDEPDMTSICAPSDESDYGEYSAPIVFETLDHLEIHMQQDSHESSPGADTASAFTPRNGKQLENIDVPVTAPANVLSPSRNGSSSTGAGDRLPALLASPDAQSEPITPVRHTGRHLLHSRPQSSTTPAASSTPGDKDTATKYDCNVQIEKGQWSTVNPRSAALDKFNEVLTSEITSRKFLDGKKRANACSRFKLDPPVLSPFEAAESIAKSAKLDPTSSNNSKTAHALVCSLQDDAMMKGAPGSTTIATLRQLSNIKSDEELSRKAVEQQLNEIILTSLNYSKEMHSRRHQKDPELVFWQNFSVETAVKEKLGAKLTLPVLITSSGQQQHAQVERRRRCLKYSGAMAKIPAASEEECITGPSSYLKVYKNNIQKYSTDKAKTFSE